MKKQNRRIGKRLLGAILAAAVLLLTGCGAAKADYEYAAEPMAGQMGGYYDAPAAKNMMTEAVVMEAEEAAAWGAYDGAGTPAPEALSAQETGRKLIRRANLSLETKDLDSLFAGIEQKVKTAGGYVEDSSRNNPSMQGYASRRTGYLTVRVPSDQLDAFLADVEGSANVTFRNESVTDITLQYTDTESHRNSLMIERDKLNEMLKKAKTVEDMITIESRLSEVRYELENYESQMRLYDNQIDYSTVSIDITEVVDYTPVKKQSFGETVREGFTETVKGVGEFFRNLLMSLLIYSPVILLLILFAALVIWLVRVLIRRFRAKEEKKAAGGKEKEPKVTFVSQDTEAKGPQN